MSIAEQYGFFWETLWNHPRNAALRASRLDPTVLEPGDEVFIPEKTIKEYQRPTGARHTFKVRNVPAKLRLQFADNGAPRANVPYTLTVDGREVAPPGSRTNGDGMVECSISPRATVGVLVLGEGEAAEEYVLRLGHLDPEGTAEGVRRRLGNLGYDLPKSEEETRDALRAFQVREGLAVTGEADEATRLRLRAIHDR